jgi:Ca2+-binding RTX toxin-like protein
VDEEFTLSFTATATDPDLPANSLAFDLVGAPEGASIDPTSGVFTWMPTEAQGPGTYSFTVRVTDDGSPNLSDEVEVVVTVNDVENSRPVAAVTGPTDGVRSQPRPFVLTADDADPADMTAGFRFDVDWGDGSPVETIGATPGNGAGVPVDHVYADEGDFIVTVVAIDQNGAVSDEATHTIAITRVALQDDPLAPGETMLAIGGGSADDVIRIRRGAGAGNLVVQMNGVREGLFRPTNRVVVFGGDGNDRINVLAGVTVPAWAYGGLGDDDLFAGGAAAVLLGGDGADSLVGRAARDILIGGAGGDSLGGRGGDDLLIDGTTAFDTDEASLAAIQCEWLSANDYPTRVANVRANFLVTEDPDRTIFDDGVADFLVGNLGRDAFFANLDAGVVDLIFRPAANEERLDVD